MDALDAARQAAWEVQAVERAVVRYREASASRDVMALPPGRRVLVSTVGPVTAEMAKLREQAAAGMQSRGKPAEWWAPVLGFEPDTLAVVAVSCAMGGCRVPSRIVDGRRHRTLPVFSKLVAATLRDQADHDRWAAEQKAAERAARRAGKEGQIEEGSDWRKFRAAFPAASRKDFARYARKISLARSEPWGERVRVKVGAVLATALAAAAPDWFEVGQFGTGPVYRRPLGIALTERAMEVLRDVDARAEVARPLLLPMIVEPNPWRYAE